MDFFNAAFLISVLQIIAIDILLGGDNAVVIALACRKLPPEQRNKGILWGVAGAIALRVVLIFFALQLLQLPFLKIVGALLLFWIGIKLMLPDDDTHADVVGATSLMGAIKTIVVADAVMSLDNVIAVAGAAKGDMTLVVFGILISIPIIVWGSQLVLKLMDRFPVVITLGAGLLGWIAGGMLVGDVWVQGHWPDVPNWVHHVTGAIGALGVVGFGTLMSKPLKQETRVLKPRNKILFPIDGSEHALHAMQQWLAQHPDWPHTELHLVNVQLAVDGHVKSVVDAQELNDYQREGGLADLAKARQWLDDHGISYQHHVLVGHPADQICRFAEEYGISEIVMGSHGRTGLLELVMGSVATEVQERAGVPVHVAIDKP